MVNGQKYHILYKTTCTVNGNFYIGVHSTTNLGDGYLGSGKRLSNSIQKHGKENHIREILEFFETREDLMEREREIVNIDLLKEEKCMNLKRGGEGGLHLVDKEVQKRIHEGSSKWIKKQWGDPDFRKKVSESASISGKNRAEAGKIIIPSFKGKKHSDEFRKKIGEINSKKQLGEKNSQFGTCWLNNGEKNIKIKKENIKFYLELGYLKGRI